MLTKKDIINLYQDGLVIKNVRKKHPKCIKGEFDPSLSEIYLYWVHIKDNYERDITVLHEFVHARNDYRDIEDCELEVEQEAVDTYNKRPYILEQIIKLFKLDWEK